MGDTSHRCFRRPASRVPLPPSSYDLFLSSIPQILIPRILRLPGVKDFPWGTGRKVGNQLGVGGNRASLWEGAPWLRVNCYGTGSVPARSFTKEKPLPPRPTEKQQMLAASAQGWELVTMAQVWGPSTTALKGIWPFKSWSLPSVREQMRVSGVSVSSWLPRRTPRGGH